MGVGRATYSTTAFGPKQEGEYFWSGKVRWGGIRATPMGGRGPHWVPSRVWGHRHSEHFRAQCCWHPGWGRTHAEQVCRGPGAKAQGLEIESEYTTRGARWLLFLS